MTTKRPQSIIKST